MIENSERGQFPAKRADFQAKIKEIYRRHLNFTVNLLI